MIEIVAAQSGEALEQALRLAQEYLTWMIAEIQEHYPTMDIHEFAAEHDYDDVRKKFPGEHVSPDGCILIALSDGRACGCVALGRLTENIAEMRTLYVQSAFRGAGVGKKLIQAAIVEACKLGYGSIRLDTLAFMNSALSAYRSRGFLDIEPYRDMPPSVRRHICFLELRL